jgi:hypothetical protein
MSDTKPISQNPRTPVDARASGGELIKKPAGTPGQDHEFLAIPSGSGSFIYRTVELPLEIEYSFIAPPESGDEILIRQVDPSTKIHTPPGHIVFTRSETSPPGPGEYYQDASTFLRGYIELNHGDSGKTVEFLYTARGSLVFASDINDLSDGSLLKDDSIKPRHLMPPATFVPGTGPGQADGPDFTIPGDLRVNGDLTVVKDVTNLNTETINLDDNILLLNSNVTGAPSEDSGLEIQRGTSTNTKFVWNETADSWDFTGDSGSVIFSIGSTSTGFGFNRLDNAAEATYVGGLGLSDGGSVWFNTDDSQFKGWNGTAIVILG